MLERVWRVKEGSVIITIHTVGLVGRGRWGEGLSGEYAVCEGEALSKGGTALHFIAHHANRSKRWPKLVSELYKQQHTTRRRT